MAEVVATSLLGYVSHQLASKSLSEFALLSGIHKELKRLESTLSTIQDVLEDAETRQVKEKALRSWLRKLKDLAYDADDVLDDFATGAARLKPGTAADTKEKVRSSFLYLPKSIAFRHNIAQRVKQINERLDEIAGERSKFNLKEGALPSIFTVDSGPPAREEVGSFVNESEVYGRREDKQQIVELLMNSSSQGQGVDVVSIVGLGGLGKTTLAQLAYNDARICGHFENRMWVFVSEDFEMRRIVRSILESATGSEFGPLNLDTTQVLLTNHLREKRFLLVLDDVWNESHEKWDRLRTLLAVGAKGSKVVVTTRSERVASIMGAFPPFRLSTLPLDDCRLLFERRAFGNGVEKDPNLIEIGREIVKKCGGVPLAAKALGSLLRFKRTESGWLAIKDSELWNLSGDESYEILPALKLSYDHLSPSLKQCFAYCSILPKDCKINAGMLARLWRAEGFLKPSGASKGLEQIGLQYVDELIERSLFQRSVEEVSMHDLVHDLARFVAGDECSIVDAAAGRFLSQNARYASFICGKAQLSAALQPLHRAKKLRTFFLHPATEEMEGDDEMEDELLRLITSGVKLLRALHLSRYPLKALPDSFKKLKHLRYLDLSNTPLDSFPASITALPNLQTLILHNSNFMSVPDSIKNLQNLSTLDLYHCSYLSSLPGSIGNLKSLVQLDLSRTRIKSLPESICELTNLHTLGLRNCYFIHELPQNMSGMKGLVHLNIHGCAELACMPRRLGKLTQLRTMPMYIPGEKTGCSLAELGSLKLEGELKIKKLQNVRRVGEAADARLNEKLHIQSLKLSWGSTSQGSQADDDEDDNHGNEDRVLKIQHVEDVLESLQPSKNLRDLGIEGFVGRSFPRWMMDLSLTNLVSITLTRCDSTRIPALGQLPKLEVLNLESLPRIKHLGWDFHGGANPFPSLKELELIDMAGLEEWRKAGEEPFLPRLHKLALLDCPKLKELPSDFPSVATLTMNADDKLLSSSLQSGGFSNLKHLVMKNYDDEGPMPEALAERCESLTSWSLQGKPERTDGDSSTMSSFGFGMAKVISCVETTMIYM